MEIFDRLAGHEQVVVCQDAESGLRAIIAVHSTALGPALGGTRFHPYRSDLEALDDVLRLSRAMTYKNAVAGLDLGGGKAVIIGDPRRDRSEPLLRAYGRFVASLGGRYVTACDVGTYVPDMDLVARETRWVTGRSTGLGGSGDSSLLTAVGVMAGMRACAQHRWGSPTLEGRRVGVVGVGKVGHRLVAHLLADGARVVVTDSDAEAVARVRAAHPEVDVAGSAAEVAALPLDVYSPNALGGALDDGLVAALRAEVVCGGANNQLARQALGDALATRGVLYAPDFVVNAGGVIQVADELDGYDPERAQARAEGIFDTTLAVLRTADAERVAPATAADRLAERRIAQVGRLRTIMLPR